MSRACVDDGPGLRTVVFFKGCPLRCPWCHNPEGRSPRPQIALDADACLACGQCRRACPRPWPTPARWRSGCTGCGACARACPSGARQVVGRTCSVEDLAREAARDADFFAGTGGGVTLSGGEPMAQPDAALALARELRRRDVHVALETSGCWPGDLAAEVASAFDLVLLEIKHVDHQKLARTCGDDAGRALENLRLLGAAGATVQPRMTLVPGFNDSPEDLRQVAASLADLGPAPTLLPFHRLARAKEARLGCTYPYANVPPSTNEQLALARRILRDRDRDRGRF